MLQPGTALRLPDLADATAIEARLATLAGALGLSPAAVQALERAARAAGDAAAEGILLALADTPWQALETLADAGQPLNDAARADLAAALAAAWGPEGPRLATAIDGEVWDAYGAGRAEALALPEALRTMPRWQFVAIRDERTSAICRACDGTVLAAGDPWFEDHTPPLHPHCRSEIRGVGTDTAVTADPSAVVPADRFLDPPPRAWTPPAADYPPALWDAWHARKMAV